MSTGLGWTILISSITMVGGAILGYFFTLQHEKNKRKKEQVEKIDAEHKIKERRSMLRDLNTTSWLIRYYAKNHALEELYTCKIGDYEATIPFLTKDAWQKPIKWTKDQDFFSYVAPANAPAFPVDSSLIDYRKSLGYNLFDAPTLYWNRKPNKESSFKIYGSTCLYYQMATNLISLEEETYRAAKADSFQSTPRRDACLSNLEKAESTLDAPFSLGCTACLVLKTAGSWEIVLHRRSYETVTYGGKLAVIPNFGLTIPTSQEDKIDLIKYNFIKEYCEELYDREEAIKEMESRYGDPCWFYHLYDEAKELLEAWDKGQFDLYYLGFGLDALNGAATIAMAAVINDEAYANKIKKGITMGWEIGKRDEDDSPPLLLVDYKDPRLQEWLRKDRYQTSSIFTITKTLEFLEELETRSKK